MPQLPSTLIASTPGLAGRILDFIEETAIYHQPDLSLAATIAAMGVLKGHKFATSSNLRTNHLIVGLAPSGSGKGHALKVIERLFAALDLQKLLSGKPASDVGLLRSLGKTGRKLLQWDEFGLALKTMTNIRAASYKANILTIMMDTFSSSSGMYLGMEYSNADGKRDRIDIDQPCLCLYGTSTPTRFYEALSSDFGSDGFLPRLLLFDSPAPKEKISYKQLKANFNLPEELVSEMRARYSGNVADIPIVIKPEIVEVSPGAYTAVQTILEYWQGKKDGAKSDIERAIYSRAVEHVLKIALTVEDESHLSHAVLGWADDLVRYLIFNMIEAVKDRVADSEYHRVSNRLMEIVRDAKIISRRDLVRRTQRMKPFERDTVLKSLCEAERIGTFYQVAEPLGKGYRRDTLFYKFIE